MEPFTMVRILQLLFVANICHAGELPKYRAVAYPQIFDGRDENTRVLKINDDISLNLEPSSILHEDFFIRTYENGVLQYQSYDARELQRNFYQDRRNFAAVMLSEEDGTLRVDGVVGPNLKITPMDTTERSEDGRQAHLIESIENTDSAEVYGKVTAERFGLIERAESSQTGFDDSKYNVQEIFPEILVVCDSRFQAQFNKKMNLTTYMMITLQVVNIRYSALVKPKVNIVLRGIELTQYQQEHEYYVYSGGNTIDAYKSLQNLVKFVAKNNNTYGWLDMVYFVTSFDMVAIYADGTRQESLEGYAFVASACTENRQELGEDAAYTFKGIRIMTHEVAHTLGCSHDGTSSPGIVKSFIPDSLRCPWGHGYIMSYQQQDQRSMQFSDCCRYDIQQMSWSYQAGCLHINNSETFPLNWLHSYQLPGDFLSLDRQCRMTYPFLHRTYFINETDLRLCRGYCFVPGEQYDASDGQWDLLFLDGTPCSKNGKHICLNGVCREDKRGRRRRRRS